MYPFSFMQKIPTPILSQSRCKTKINNASFLSPHFTNCIMIFSSSLTQDTSNSTVMRAAALNPHLVSKRSFSLVAQQILTRQEYYHARTMCPNSRQ